MKAIINNFRMARHHQKDNHMIITLKECDNREKAETYVGKEVLFKTETGKDIKGKVASAHGNSGALRVIFEKGMPGQSVGQEVDLKA